MHALQTAATGMAAQDLHVQVISNNIANMSTTGYKRQRAEFSDLLYEHVRRIGSQASDQGNILPVGIDLGSGVKTVGTPRVMTQGSLSQTGNAFDMAVIGDGFFKIQMPDGTFSYTRDGSFQMDGTGRLVTTEGYVVQPGITVPQNATGFTVNAQGQVSVTPVGSTTPTVLGQLTLTRFLNQAGLLSVGDNLFQETPASGPPQDGLPGTNGAGTVQQASLEQSNVEFGDRDFRPDRGAARLRDELQSDHRREPDVVRGRRPPAMKGAGIVVRIILAAAALALAVPAAAEIADRLTPQASAPFAFAQFTGALPPLNAPAAPPSSALAPPTLKRRITVTSEIVRLGDLIDNAGDLRGHSGVSLSGYRHHRLRSGAPGDRSCPRPKSVRGGGRRRARSRSHPRWPRDRPPRHRGANRAACSPAPTALARQATSR